MAPPDGHRPLGELISPGSERSPYWTAFVGVTVL